MLALICDDDPSARFVLKRLLTQHLGCATLESDDGVGALTRLEHNHVDLLILDLQMPTMDGFEVLEALRSTPALKHLPVVVVSNERREQVVRRLLAIGVDGYVLKPVRAERLVAVLDGLRPRLAGGRKAAAGHVVERVCLAPETPAMLVDGNLDYRHFFVTQARRFGPVVEASSGAAALAAWKTATTPLVFIGADLGILDVARLVPKLRALSAGEALRLVRIVDGDPQDVAWDGCDDAMRRSFVAEVFRRSLRPFIRPPGPLAAVTRLVGDSESLVASAARQVFGMMLDAELIPVQSPSDFASCVGATATMSVAHQYVVSFKLFATPQSLMAAAERMLSMSAADLTDEDLISTAGELVNLITGRLHAVMDERGVVSECSLPTLVATPASWVASDIEDRGTLQHFQIVGTPAIVHMTFEVSQKVVA